MYKLLFKNILSLLFIATIVAFTSCIGNTSKYDALQESIIKFKDSVEPIDIVKYIPKTYSEIKTDTILSNGFKVNIKLFTDMQHSLVNEYEVDFIRYKEHHRVIKADITVLKADKEIFKKTIDKRFLKTDSNDDIYLRNANIRNLYIDEFASINSNKVVLNIPIHQFNERSTPTYNIIIDDKGNYSIHLLKTS